MRRNSADMIVMLGFTVTLLEAHNYTFCKVQ